MDNGTIGINMATSMFVNYFLDILNIKNNDKIIETAHEKITENTIVSPNDGILPVTDISKEWVVLLVSALTLVLGSKITADSLSNYKIFNKISFLLRILIKTVVGTIISLALLPILLLFYIVLWTVSQISHLYVKTFISRNITKAEGTDIIWGLDSIKSPAYIYCTFKVEGKPKLEKLKIHFTERIINLKSSVSGKEQFIKFKQLFCSIGQTLYWKYDENFDINNHIKMKNIRDLYPELSSKEGVSGQDLVCRYLEDFGLDPVGDGNVPKWEITCLITGENEYFYYLRCHHGMGDGVSYVRMMLEYFNDEPIKAKLVPDYPSLLVRLAMGVWSFSFIPYAIATMIYKGSNNPLHGPELNGEKYYIAAPEIPFQIIREIKNRSKTTTVHDVLFTGLSTAVGKFFKKKSKYPPSKFTLFFPIGMADPNSEVELSNSFVIGVTSLPVARLKSVGSLSSLYEMHEAIERSKEDPTSLALYYLINIYVNILPISIAKVIYNLSGITLAVSNLPGPPKPLTVMGQKLREMRIWAPDRDPFGIVATFITHDGALRSNLRVDTALIKSRDEAVELMNDMAMEFKRMAEILNIKEAVDIC